MHLLFDNCTVVPESLPAFHGGVAGGNAGHVRRSHGPPLGVPCGYGTLPAIGLVTPHGKGTREMGSNMSDARTVAGSADDYFSGLLGPATVCELLPYGKPCYASNLARVLVTRVDRHSDGNVTVTGFRIDQYGNLDGRYHRASRDYWSSLKPKAYSVPASHLHVVYTVEQAGRIFRWHAHTVGSLRLACWF